MFKRLPGIGLDIGSQKIKMLQAVRRKHGLEIVKFGSILTPPGTVDAGNIVEPELLGEALRSLAKNLKFSGKRVVSAVGGQHLYIRNLIMPKLKLDEMRAAVYYQATKFLPIPVEEAAIDIAPLRDFEDQQGKKTEVLFLAVRKQQVENLEIVCQISELKLAAVEIEPLGLLRAWGKDAGAVVALLAMVPSRSYLTVFKQGIPVFYRSIGSGDSNLYNTSELEEITSGRRSEKMNIITNRQFDLGIMEIIKEVKGALQYYQSRIDREEDSIDKILLCGGATIRGLIEGLAQGLKLELSVVDILAGNVMPRSLSKNEENELRFDFPLALGLAAREVF